MVSWPDSGFAIVRRRPGVMPADLGFPVPLPGSKHPLRLGHGGGQQAACPRHTQQPATGLLQGGEVGHTAKAEEAT